MDQNPLHKAAALVEAYGYIRAFAGKTVVVKIGGSIMDEPDNLMSLVEDVCFMAAVGMRPVLVHGGGKAINAAMSEACLLYTSPSPRDQRGSRMPSSA